MKLNLFLLLLVLSVSAPAAGTAQSNILSTTQSNVPNIVLSGGRVLSPDGKLEMQVTLRDGRPVYTVSYKGVPIVLESPLGITGWERNLTLTDVTVSSQDSLWRPVYGERSEIRDHYNRGIVRVAQANNPRKRMDIEVRAYDEGVAFRYIFLESGSYLHIDREYTEFTLPEGTMAYHAAKAQAVYNKLPLKGWTEEAERPLVLELPGGLYACLAEAGVDNYTRTKFMLSPDKANTIACSMYGFVDEIDPFATPWRVVMAAEKPGQLLENNYLLLNLNPPCAIAQTGWIKPGKVMREATLTTQGGLDLVDFAVKRNLQYIHFDAGWYGPEGSMASDATFVSVDPARNPVNDLDLEKVTAYANQHGIGVWVYVNQRALARQLDEILPLYQKWGVKGVKFGFVQVGSHMWTKWMHDAVRKCAEHQLMVDIHDEYRPTGFSRTYPNLLTQEGIRGNEEFPDATHNVTLPFTRFIAGAGDYTICYYRQDFNKHDAAAHTNGLPLTKVIRTTSAHQLAMAVAYYSPLQFLYWYDRPSDSRDEPELEFFDRVPTVWDDTKVLEGAIGQYISIARRSGDDWFVGVMTNNDARTMKVALDFLPAGKKYTAHMHSDGGPETGTRTRVKVETRAVDSRTVLDAKLLPSGGMALWLEAAK